MSDDFSTNRHGPDCLACAGKGWLNTADQNRREDQLASLLRVAEAAREIVEYVRTANLAESKLLSVKAEYNDGDSYNLNGPFMRLKQHLAALPAPGERKAGDK